MSDSPVERFFKHVQSELNRERAATLGRYGRRVEQAIARCDALADDPSDEALADYRRARVAALEAIDALCLQREALGLLDHRWVDRIYPRPPAR